MSAIAEVVLEVKNLEVQYPVTGGVVRALDGVSLEVRAGEIVAVVGESGCGKTTLAKAVLGLQKIVHGSIDLGGRPVEGTSRDMASRVGMVWQDPYASLNPRWKISRSIVEAAKLMKVEVSVAEIMQDVGLDERFTDRFPHELSGGQRQRVAIGRALALQPPLIICDEPTSALDLSIRAQILNLLRDVRQDKKCAFLYISHDLTTVRFLADRIAVMYMGRIVETGPTEELFTNPRHPYTKALLDSAPTLEKLMYLPEPLEGELPDPKVKIEGCRFASRCVRVQDVCRAGEPPKVVFGTTELFCNNPFGDA
jgi:oligopeptide/dipeptide ABC transporter ATP-binding protein